MLFGDNSELRLIQYRSASSAANDDYVDVVYPGPPAGKVWEIVGMGYYPSVAETQVVSFQKVLVTGGVQFSLLNPVSLNLNPAIATPIEQGMSTFLLPGEYLRVRRVTHTAGSSMNCYVQFIEYDIPLYDYSEPQVAARLKRNATSLAQRVFRAGGGGGGGGSTGSATRGRTGPLPK